MAAALLTLFASLTFFFSRPGGEETIAAATAHRTMAMTSPSATVETTVAEEASPPAASERIFLREPGPISPERAAFLAGLNPRKPHPKHEPQMPHRGEDHRIVVKFKDAVKARPDADGKLSLVATKLPADLVALAESNALEFRSYFVGIEDRMTEIEERSAKNSGNAQADFLGVASLKLDHPGKTLEVAKALNRLDVVEYAYVESRDATPPPPSDYPPQTSDLTRYQTWRLTDPGLGTDFAWASNGKGQGVRVSVLEGAYHRNHEDLVDANLNYRLEQDFGSSVPTAFSPNVDVVSPVNGISPREHGTSTLGVLCAQENSYGMTGMVPEATIDFYSENTVNSTFTRSFIIALAAANSAPGDIMLLEMQSDFMFATNVFGPAEMETLVWDTTKAATDAGVIVVAAAGNGGIDLDSPAAAFYKNRGDSGAIIVGAGEANTTHRRLSFSTYGSRVNVQAWGASVATLGDGDYNVGVGVDQNYKSNYSGTSSASALVAAAAACVQSIERASTATTVTPISMRSILRNNGRPQSNAAAEGKIGNAVDLQEVVRDRFSGSPKYVVETATWVEDFTGGNLPYGFEGWRFLAEPNGGLVRNADETLRLETSLISAPKLCSATLHLRLAGKEGVILDFKHRNHGDTYDGAGVDHFTGTADVDGVFMSPDGMKWYRLSTPTLSTSGSSWFTERVGLDAAIEAAGIEYTNDFQIRFQRYGGDRYFDGFSFRPTGRSFDDVSVRIGQAGVLEFGAASTVVNVREGENAVLTIRRLEGSEDTVGVRLRTVLNGSASQNDLPSIPYSYSFGDGEIYRTISIPTFNDNTPERTETFTLELYDPGNGARLGNFRTATVRILDDDTAGSPGLLFHDTNTTVVNFDPDAPGATMAVLPIEVPTDGPDSFRTLMVRVNGLSHDQATDLDLVLESPDGRRVMLMSDAGSPDFNIPNSGRLDRVNLEFAAGATAIPATGPVRSGTYAPADYPPSPDQMPAPIGTFNGSTDLQAFDGIDPRGTWTLYIQDQWNGSGGSLLAGWELILTDGTPVGGYPPRIEQVYIASGRIHLDFTTRLGFPCEIESSTDLNIWHTETSVPGTGTTVHRSLAMSGPQRYFRVVESE